MDIGTGIVIAVGTLLAALFNYYLNRAPGSDPDDFQVGPPELGITCDCYLNTLIVSVIGVVAVLATSSSFGSVWELVIVGATVFFTITIAGILGRHHRYREWKTIQRVLVRAVPSVSETRPSSTDLYFDEDEEE
ncbi:MAG: hypothetical protein ACFFEJ_14510 [Candidatus Thorarchaeota archaeon]